VDVSSPLPGNFSGSMVVSSDQPVVAIGQITNRQFSQFGVGIAGGYASEQYRGSPANSSTLNYPLVKSSFNGKTTIFTVQAAGADVAATATILTSDGTSHTKSLTIAANRSVTFGPSDGFSPAVATTGCGTDPNVSPCFGSLTVVGNNNIAGVALEFEDGKSPATAVQAASMFGTEDVGSTVLCPIIKNDFGGNHRTTGMSIANTGTEAANVTAKFTTSAGATFTEGPHAIAPGKSFVFSAFAPATIGGMPAATLAGAKVTSDKPTIVGVVSERNISGSPVKFTTYTCFNPANATAKVAAPVFKMDFGNNTTGIQIQNANETGDVNVSTTFSCDAGTTTFGPITGTVAPGASLNIFRPAAVPVNKLCAVTIDAGGANKIVAILNESSDAFPGTDTFLLNTKNYEGFNL
jgi:hypothetical protein